MNQTILPRLREFARALLERRGSLVDWPDSADQGLAVLSPEAAAAIGTSTESLPLSAQPGGQGLCVNLATDFLEKVQPLLSAEPRIGCLDVPEAYLKKAAMDEPVARAFTWQNARVRVVDSEAARVGYQTWYFLAALDSDDRWEELVSVSLNARSLAQVALPDPLSLDTLPLYESPAAARATPPPAAITPAMYQQAVRRAGAVVSKRAAGFISRLESRLGRDRKRLRDYYHALLRQTMHPRRQQEEDPERQEARRRAVELELRRKLAELDERYRVRASLAPQVLIHLQTPVLAVRCEVLRRQARKVHVLYWNPVLKALEPMSCSACGEPIFSVFFTDGDVQPLCGPCAG